MLANNQQNDIPHESSLNTSAINNMNKSTVSRSLNLTPIKIKKEFRGSFIDVDNKPLINSEINDKENNKEQQTNKNFNNLLPENFTVIFIGQKQVGKSSLINRILNKSFNLEYDETILDPYCCERLYELEENKNTLNKNYNKKAQFNNDNSLLCDHLNDLDNFKLDFSFDENNEIKLNQLNTNTKQKQIKEGYNFRVIDTGDFDTYKKDIEDLFKISNCIVFVYSIDSIKSFRKIKEIYFSIQEKIKNIKNLILVGNKNDLNINRNVSFFQAVDFAESNNIKFLEASAKDEINIHKIFQTFIDTELKRNNKKELGIKKEKEKYCKCF